MAVLPAIFGTVSGAVIDRLGARPALILAALIGALVNGLYLIATRFLAFQVIRVRRGRRAAAGLCRGTGADDRHQRTASGAARRWRCGPATRRWALRWGC